MWRVDEEAFLNLSGPPMETLMAAIGSSFAGMRRRSGFEGCEDFREDFGEGSLCSRGHLDSLKNLAAGRAFNASGFSAADIEAEDRMC
jgi:hypothetical protein